MAEQKESASVRVALIGAGPCGLSLMNAFSKLSADSDAKLICFEKQSQLGGLWNYDWRTGTDAYGLPQHCSMYRHLWSNGPKECLEMCDYTFDEHFKGKNIGSFPPRRVLADYILGRVKANELDKKFDIRLNHNVLDVQHDVDTNKFTVKFEDMTQAKSGSETFDYVVVATGHFSVPNQVQFKGFDSFEGRILHAHSFRNAQEFKGQNVLVIGSSYSAEDISLQCMKFGSKSVTVSYRTNAMGFKWPAGVKEVPLLQEIVKGKNAVFADGQIVENIDSIILCTGYLHSFPFMTDELRLKTRNILYPRGLYKGVVWMNNPKLMYLGMQDQWYTFSMFDVQALYACDVMLGRVKLPDKEAMSKDAEQWGKKGDESVGWKKAIRFQSDYVLDLYGVLADGKQYVDSQEKLDYTEEFYQWEHDKHTDICTYRDQRFKSKVSGKMSAKFTVPWMTSFDDSIECFLEKSE